MAGNISDFKSSFKTDVARANKFDVVVPVPIGLLPYLGTSRELQFRCETAELPSRTFMTSEQKIYGPVEKYPYQNTYNDTNLTFIVSDDMSEKLFFDDWMDLINPSYNNHFKYKGDYAVPITITQYDVTNKSSYSINLIDAYPIAVNQLDLDWSAEGFHKLVVVFAYTRWENNSIQALGMQLLEAGLSGLVSGLGGLGGNATTGGLGTGISNATDSLGNIMDVGKINL